jgi:hypothetical protein
MITALALAMTGILVFAAFWRVHKAVRRERAELAARAARRYAPAGFGDHADQAIAVADDPHRADFGAWEADLREPGRQP